MSKVSSLCVLSILFNPFQHPFRRQKNRAFCYFCASVQKLPVCVNCGKISCSTDNAYYKMNTLLMEILRCSQLSARPMVASYFFKTNTVKKKG